MRCRQWLRGVACLVAVLLTCCAPPASQAQVSTDKATLVLQWNHQSQFAGYYMAVDQGYYEEEGLDVRLLRGGPDVRACELLQSGAVDFCSSMLSTALEKREQGIPLVLLSQIVNRGSFILVAWRKPPGGGRITSLSDLTRRRVTIWKDDFRTPYLALFTSKGVQPEVLPQYYTLSLFLRRGAAACSAMRYNEYHTLLQSGVAPDDLIIFDLHEQGIRLPEDGIYCLEQTRRSRPEYCQRFARASRRGWQYARQHFDETLDVVMEYVERDNLPTNRMHMKWMLEKILEAIFPGPEDQWKFSVLSPEDYASSLDLLCRYGGLTQRPIYETFVAEEARHVAR